MIGNGLRELDRFLNLLLDEVAAESGWTVVGLKMLGRQRNTANKLEDVCNDWYFAADDAARLRALARCRNCLIHCNGLVRRGDDRTALVLTAAWPSSSDRRQTVLRMGDELVLDAAVLAWIGRFYRRLGTDLLQIAYRGKGNRDRAT